MASSLWKVSINGAAPVTLDSLGIRGAVVEKVALAMSTLKFVVPVEDIAAAAPFTYGQSIILTRSGVNWFIGRVRDVAANFGGGGPQFWAVSICDAWWEMEHTVYRQPAVVYNADFSAKVGFMSTRVTLYQDAWGQLITQGEQIHDAIIYASAQAPGKINTSTPPQTEQWQREETREITVAEAVRRAASLAPSSIAYPEYTAGIWNLAYASRGSLALVSIDLDDNDKLVDIPSLEELDAPPGVVFDFITTVEDGEGMARAKLNRQSAGIPGGPGTIYATFQLGGCDTVPAGAAAAYYAAHSSPHWVGTIRIMEQECTGMLKPGNSLRLTNGQAAWATMNAVVKSVTEELDTGLSTVKLGPPDALSVDHFIDQLIRLRNRPHPTAYCRVQHNGTEGVDTAIDDNGDTIAAPPSEGDGTGGGEGAAGGPDGTAGVTSPATGNAPGFGGVGQPPAEGNSSAGNPFGLFIVYLASIPLCDGGEITVLSLGNLPEQS